MRCVLFLSALLLSMLSAVPAVASDHPWRQKARQILADTVAMRTAVGHGQVPKMAEYLAQQLLDGGFAPEDIQIERMGETATFVAFYRSKAVLAKRPILVLAHMDVVEADPNDWVLDPFTLTEKDGYLFGRGVEDNKLGIALSVATFLRLRAEGFEPSRDIILAFTGDEETKQDTTARLAGREDLRNAEFALNTDAGGGRLDSAGNTLAYFMQAAEKTYASFDITVRNPGGHSSAPRQDNAIYALADALKAVQAYRFPVQVNDITQGFMSAMGKLETGEAAAALTALAANPNDRRAADLLWTRPDLVGTTRTTCVATMLNAGHAENALPQRASATVNCRIFPDVDPEQVRAALQVAAGSQTVVSLIDKAYLASASPLNEQIAEAVGEAVQARVPGTPVIPAMSSGYTDGSFFRAAGVPTYGVGAAFMRPEDSFAHGLNERVPVASLYEGLAHWHKILMRLAD